MVVPISKMIEIIRSWFAEQLPKPETINLSEYIEIDDLTEGTFTFSNGESVKLCQQIEDIEKYILKSEKEEENQIDQSQQTMSG